MFRRIISNGAMMSTQTQRWSELSKFACLRASLNKESEKGFQELAQKNKISTQELVELSKIVSMNLNSLKQNVNSDSFPQEKEATLRRYRESTVGTRGHLVDVHAAVTTKYPLLGQHLGQVAGYKEAYEALRNIFINPSIAVHNLRSGIYGEKFAADFRTKADEYVNSLLKEHEKNPEAIKTIKEIKVTLNHIIENYSKNPASIYGRILTLLQSRSIDTQIVASKDTKALSQIKKSNVPSLNVNELTAPTASSSVSQAFNAELAFIKEANLILQQNVGNLPWDGTKKKIFQGFTNSYSEVPYYLLAILSGLGLAYFLYSGDAKYKTLLLTPVVGIAALVLFKRNQILNRVPTLTELFLHKDGKHVDAVISINGQLVNKTNVPINSVRLYRGDHNVTLDLNTIDKANYKSFLTEVSGEENKITYNFSKIRSLAARDGQVLSLGDVEVVVPFHNQGNRLLLKEIFKGVEVLPSS